MCGNPFQEDSIASEGRPVTACAGGDGCDRMRGAKKLPTKNRRFGGRHIWDLFSVGDLPHG